jgi:hypothetical protein
MTIEVIHGSTEAGFDFITNFIKRNGRKIVLELQQILRGFRSDNIGTGCQCLTQFDRCRPDGL